MDLYMRSQEKGITMTMSIAKLINTLFNTHMVVHETYYQKGWVKGLIKAQYVQIRQWDNISRWGQILQAAETLLAVDDDYKQVIYENMADSLVNVVGAIEDPRSIVLTVSNNGSVIQIAVRYQYSWL